MPQLSVVSPARSHHSAVPAAFTCSRSPGRLGAVWVHLTGELDLSSADVLAEQLREAQGSSYLVAVDLRRLEFIDGAGLGVLVDAEAEARRTGRSLVLIRGGGQVDRMMETAGLHERFEVVDLRASEEAYQVAAGASRSFLSSDTADEDAPVGAGLRRGSAFGSSRAGLKASPFRRAG